MSRSRFLVSIFLLIGMLVFLIPGCDDLITEVNEVTLAGHPTADFSVDIDSGCIPLTVTFTDQSNGPRNRWLWKFGDGDSATDTTPTHTYDSVGVYTVTLSIFDDELEGSDTEVKNRFIIAGQSVDSLAVSDTLACPGTEISFEAVNSGGIVNWKWNFGDSAVNSVSQLPTPTHVYDSVGVYTVTLITTGGCGLDTIVYSDLIRITPCPTAAFTAVPPVGCKTLTIDFTDNSAPPAGEVITTWQWDFGNGRTAITQDASIPYTTSGSFEVSLMVTADGGGSDTFYDTVEVHDSSSAAFSAIGPVVSCLNPSRQFQVKFLADAPGLVDSLLWSFGDGSAIYNDTSPVHAYTVPGTYAVSLEVWGCRNDRVEVSDFVVLSDPLPPLLYSISPDTGTVLTVFNFADTSAPAAVKYWNWDFGDGSLIPGDEAVVTHSYADTGSFIITLTVFNDCDSLQIIDTIRVEP